MIPAEAFLVPHPTGQSTNGLASVGSFDEFLFSHVVLTVSEGVWKPPSRVLPTMAIKRDIYISIDIEADGPYPGSFSMLSLGAAAFLPPSREPVATFEVNLKPLHGAGQHPDTMAWWSGYPDAWEHATKDPITPSYAINNLINWVAGLRQLHQADPVMVVYPSWDYMWVQWYLAKFSPEDRSPFGLGSLDVKTLAMASLKLTRFKEAAKRRFPKRWEEGQPKHTHKAVEDAIGQGVLFVNIINELLAESPK